MKKKHLLVIALFVLVMSLVLVVPASANVHGCTPGYWKQEHHFDSWVPTGYAPDDYVDEVFCWGDPLMCPGPHITLLEALKAKGGGENAFMRHAVAALLNSQHPDLIFWNGNAIYLAVGHWGSEQIKDFFEMHNEYGCPLD